MENENQVKSEQDEMPPPPVQDAVSENTNDDEDNDDDGVAYEDYDLIGVPGQVSPKPVAGNSSDEEEGEEQNDDKEKLEDEDEDEDENEEEEQSDDDGEEDDIDDDQEDDLDDDQKDLQEGQMDDGEEEDDENEAMSSEVEDGSDSDEEDPKEGRAKATHDDVSSDVDTSTSEEDDMSSSYESDDTLERSYKELKANQHKTYSDMVKLLEISLKLGDLEKVDLSFKILDTNHSVPAHIWLKYLKATRSVTQTPDEVLDYELKCATALSTQYNIPLAEYIVGFLEEQEAQNHVLWAQLVADYDVERPDYGQRLRAKFNSKQRTEAEVAKFQKLMLKHCPTWLATPEERKTISSTVAQFKRHLVKMSMLGGNQKCSKLPKVHVKRALRLDIGDDIKNAIIRFIFERIIAKFITFDSIWIAYIRFVQNGDEISTIKANPYRHNYYDDDEEEEEEEEEKDGDPEIDHKLASRLSKGFLTNTALELGMRGNHIQPSVRLSHLLLAMMERAQFDPEDVYAQVCRTLRRCNQDIPLSVELHLDYLAYRVRNTDYENVADIEKLRSNFARSWDDLDTRFGNSADSGYEILQLWANMEYARARSPDMAQNIWRRILNYPGACERGLLWIGFAQMEYVYNGGADTLDILRSALQQPVLSEATVVQQFYRRLERCFGTYESIADCQAMGLPSANSMQDPRKQIPHQYSPHQTSHHYDGQQEQSSLQYHGQQEQTSLQYHRPQDQTSHRYNRPQQQTPLYYNRQEKQQASPQRSQTQQQAPLNRQERRRQTHAKMMGRNKQATVGPHPVAQQDSTKAESYLKYSAHLETNKVFVRNLHPACTKNELEELFKPFGHVKDVRVVHKQLQKKGIAYIEYEKPEEAEQAVTERNGYELRGFALFVAISNPPPKNKPAGTGSTAAADGGVAQVAGKKRVLTSLIPTTVVRQEAVKKRRIELVQEEGDDPEPSTSSNGKAATETDETAAPKSNEDFRKMFLNK